MHFSSTSSALMVVRVPKLYGTFMPTWTPAHVELGFADGPANAVLFCSNEAAPGTPAIASFPHSRLVYVGIVPPSSRFSIWHPLRTVYMAWAGSRLSQLNLVLGAVSWRVHHH